MDARLTPGTLPIEVLFVLLPDSLLLDWAGPAEALRMANQRLRDSGQPEAFVLHFIGPQTAATSSVGATISGLAPLPQSMPERSWVVLVGQPGATIAVDSMEAETLVRWLRGLRLGDADLGLPAPLDVEQRKGQLQPGLFALGDHGIAVDPVRLVAVGVLDRC